MNNNDFLEEKIYNILDRIAENNIIPSDFEDHELDFKRKIETNKELLEDVICFANAEGGCIVVGVDDKEAGLNSIVGVNINEYNLSDFLSYIFKNTSPNIEIKCKTILYKNRHILILGIPKANKPTMTSGGVFKKRIGRECLPFNPVEFTTEQEKSKEKNPFNEGWEVKIEPLQNVSQDINFINSILENFVIKHYVSLFGKNKLYLYPFLPSEENDYVKNISKDKIEIYLTAKGTGRTMYFNNYRKEKWVIYNDFKFYHYFTFIEDSTKLFKYSFLDKNVCILLYYFIQEFFNKYLKELNNKFKLKIKILGLKEKYLNIKSDNILFSFNNNEPKLSNFKKIESVGDIWENEIFSSDSLIYFFAKSFFNQIYKIDIDEKEIRDILKKIIL